MGKKKQDSGGRRKVEVAVAPRSGARVYRIAAWVMVFMVLGLVGLITKRIVLYPNNILFLQICKALLFLLPPIGVAAGVIGCTLSQTLLGRWISTVPAVLLGALWLWLCWILLDG